MPGLSGYDVCRAIRADTLTGTLPIVMVTALDPAQERVKGLDAGADDFLTKPINAPELLARVKSPLRIKTFHDTVQAQAAELAELNAGLEKRVQEQLGELQRLAQLKRFFPPHLAERIVAGDVDDPLATHRREISVVILDLRGFTAFADTSEPEEVMSLLRRYHQVMGQLIQAHGGTLEQFSGGSMLIIFNDPVVIEEPAVRAVRMALEMQARFTELMATWRMRGHDISLGIGISHGYATIGAIGYEARVGYGAIGRVTNLAARLSTEARPGQILVSAPVYELIEPLVHAEEAEQVNLGGFARPVATFRIEGFKPQGAKQVDQELAAEGLHARAVQHAARRTARGLQPQSAKAATRPDESAHRQRRVRTDIATLMGSMWPDAEGDAAKVAFDSNLHRLRKLIDIDDMLVLSEGRLSLDPARCWVDVWAFDQLVSRIDRAAGPSVDADDVHHAELVKEVAAPVRRAFHREGVAGVVGGGRPRQAAGEVRARGHDAGCRPGTAQGVGPGCSALLARSGAG